MTYSRINGVERVFNDNGTMMFYRKGRQSSNRNNQQKSNQDAVNNFNKTFEEAKRVTVEIPVFPMPGKPTLLIDAEGNSKIVNKVPVGARFVGASSRFNVYEY